MAVNEADAVLFITDGSAGVTPPDREVAQTCAVTRKPWMASAGHPYLW